jgi:hypothetical protein
LRAGNRRAVAERSKRMRGGEYASQIANVRQPALVTWGATDRLIPR